MDRDTVRTPLTSSSQFIQADDDDSDLDEDDIPGFAHPGMGAQPGTPVGKGKGRAPYQPEQLAPSSAGISSQAQQLSGNIGSSAGGGVAPGQRADRQTIGGVRVETRYTGVDTLDEPVSKTIARDLFSIYTKLVQVLYPRRSSGREVLKDWDLWGPLVFCLLLAILLSVNAPPDQSMSVFTSVVVICSLGALAVTIQAKLLGGRVSFFQGLCVLGYCIAPLVIAGLVSTFVHVIYVRAPVALLAWAWCIWGK